MDCLSRFPAEFRMRGEWWAHLHHAGTDREPPRLAAHENTSPPWEVIGRSLAGAPTARQDSSSSVAVPGYARAWSQASRQLARRSPLVILGQLVRLDLFFDEHKTYGNKKSEAGSADARGGPRHA